MHLIDDVSVELEVLSVLLRTILRLFVQFAPWNERLLVYTELADRFHVRDVIDCQVGEVRALIRARLVVISQQPK